MSAFSQACRECGTQISFDSLDGLVDCPKCGTQNLPHEHHTQESVAEAAGLTVEE